MAETIIYSVPGIHCAHCEASIKEELGCVEGVSSVDVDLERKLVRVGGVDLDDAQVRSAIAEAGYEVSS